MRESSEFYDVKISQEIISEKDKNNLTNMLMKNEKTRSDSIHSDNSDSIYHINQPGNKCLFALAFIVSIAIFGTCIYICFIFC